MGKRIVFVVFLGGCFNFGSDAGGCVAAEDPCVDYAQQDASCNPSVPACFLSRCRCSATYTVDCPAEDLSAVPRDFSIAPRDLARPAGDGGGGFD